MLVPVLTQRKGLVLTNRIWSEDGGRTAASVNTGHVTTEAIRKICQCGKFIFSILLMIRGQEKMIIHVSENLRRGGWSNWAASPASTQSVAATSGMMRELGPGTMGLDIYPGRGLQQEFIPGILKMFYLLLVEYFWKVSFWKCFMCCQCHSFNGCL